MSVPLNWKKKAPYLKLCDQTALLYSLIMVYAGHSNVV